MSTKVSVNLIRAFTGPRHTRTEDVWEQVAEYCDVHLHDNRVAQASHATCYNEMWRAELLRPNRYTIFTELDVLPGPNFLDTSVLTPVCPVAAAQYVTRHCGRWTLQRHPYPGAWYVLVDKKFVHGRLHFDAGGPHNDPANNLHTFLGNEYGRCVHRLGTEDCHPRHWGCTIERDRGEHLFWSRHWNDSPESRPAGFPLDQIQAGVDRALADYEVPCLNP